MEPKGRLKEIKAGITPTIKELKFTISRIKNSPLSILGFAIIIFFVIIAISAPVLAPPVCPDPFRIWQDEFTIGSARPPGSSIFIDFNGAQALKQGYTSHIFGTVEGMDIYYACIWGTVGAFRIGFMVVVFTLIIGLIIGCIAGYYGGVIDEIMMRFTDIIFAFPGLILAMALVIALNRPWDIDNGFLALIFLVPAAIVIAARYGFKFSTLWSVALGFFGLICIILFRNILKSPSLLPMTLNLTDLDKVLIALVIVGWPGYTRVIRGEILKVKQEDYVEAAKAVGCSDLRIMIRHILPNTIYPILIIASLDIGSIVLLAAALSFLGIGAPYGYADWGQLISFSRDKIYAGRIEPWKYWYTFIIPGLFIAVFTLGWNLLGDAFRDILDPTLRRK